MGRWRGRLQHTAREGTVEQGQSVHSPAPCWLIPRARNVSLRSLQSLSATIAGTAEVRWPTAIALPFQAKWVGRGGVRSCDSYVIHPCRSDHRASACYMHVASSFCRCTGAWCRRLLLFSFHSRADWARRRSPASGRRAMAPICHRTSVHRLARSRSTGCVSLQHHPLLFATRGGCSQWHERAAVEAAILRQRRSSGRA